MGANDEIFPEAGAHAYRDDLPDAEINILDTGRFALEDHAEVVAQHIARFTARLWARARGDPRRAAAAGAAARRASARLRLPECRADRPLRPVVNRSPLRSLPTFRRRR
ncbi:hypothetical protein FRACA_1290022 [Frankia canadensis]|uniref:Uncharacterized protein n=1 Tax=Frankia canadensis TaxID=1836972 RepID=A0A2I2KKG9_9ACTN|nr:hypothetical protein FRACA_1290022 [Frankia canadensis]SOU53459.1 hypothetical protein FRACA_1290022 [Frankia canadensis]